MNTFIYENDKLGIINNDIQKFLNKYFNKYIIDRGPDNYLFIENGLVVRYIFNDTLSRKQNINDIKKLIILNNIMNIITDIQEFSNTENASIIFNQTDVNIDTFECGCIYSEEYPCNCTMINGKWYKQSYKVSNLEEEMDIN
jgi:hypothetical protein